MALVIETGAGVSGANSYVTLADARAIALVYGVTLNTDDTIAETQLANAYQYLTGKYEPLVQGVRTTVDQSGFMPREGMSNVLVNGTPAYANNVIFDDVKNAQVIAASIVEGGQALFKIGTVDTANNLASFEVVGVYKEAYKSSADMGGGLTYLVSGAVDSFMKPFLLTTYNRVMGGGGLYRDDMGYVG